LSWFGRIPRVIVGVSRWITTRYPRLRFDSLVPDGARPPGPVTRAEARAALGLAPDDLVVTHVGRLVRWKGQAVLIRALAQVRRTAPRARGLIVGTWNAADEAPGPLGGGEAYARKLRALAVELGLNSEESTRVIFAGFIPDPGLAYAAADVVTHTSTLPEPFGRTVIEAMMAGRPVVAANAGAQPEIVLDEQTGFLTPPGDAGALADRLARLLTDDDLRARMGAAARRRVETEYSLASTVRKMEEAYDLALSRSHR
jgi:glycosyltransferase involved in cell wall biosynthesis